MEEPLINVGELIAYLQTQFSSDQLVYLTQEECGQGDVGLDTVLQFLGEDQQGL